MQKKHKKTLSYNHPYLVQNDIRRVNLMQQEKLSSKDPASTSTFAFFFAFKWKIIDVKDNLQ